MAEAAEASTFRLAEEREPTGDGRRTARLKSGAAASQLFPPFPIVEPERGPKPEWRRSDLP